MFDKNIDNKKLEKVLNCLNLNDLIAEVGIHTNYTKRFDENGVEFSGGEEQKLAIARALYKDSKIFIFDEPTATIDPLAEMIYLKIFMNCLNKIKQLFLFLIEWEVPFIRIKHWFWTKEKL